MSVWLENTRLNIHIQISVFISYLSIRKSKSAPRTAALPACCMSAKRSCCCFSSLPDSQFNSTHETWKGPFFFYFFRAVVTNDLTGSGASPVWEGESGEQWHYFPSTGPEWRVEALQGGGHAERRRYCKNTWDQGGPTCGIDVQNTVQIVSQSIAEIIRQ